MRINRLPNGRVPAPNLGSYTHQYPQQPPVGVVEAEPSFEDYYEDLHKILGRLTERAETFDSFRPQSLGGESCLTLTLLLDYAEQEVRTLVVTGPTINSPTGTIANPVPVSPAVPATGVVQQNVNPYPVLVAINANGATITNVTVNGQTVGTGAGTYIVPAAGTISIAYTVATPTWVWSDANPPATFTPSGTPFTLQLGGRAWQLLLPASGILTERFNPGLLLKRSDQNQLISATAGPWAVEFTGYRSHNS